jgi:hypothetical protein
MFLTKKGEKMRRINIVKDKKIETQSFVTKEDLVSYLRKNLDFHGVLLMADNIWNLNVGTSYEAFGYKFSCASKARAGNHIVI